MSNFCQSLFANKMRIDDSSTPGMDTIQNALTAGLRTRNSIADAQKAQAIAPEHPAEAASNLPPAEQPNITHRFASEMSTRLTAANPNNLEAAANLAESLKLVAEEVKSKFGQDKANEFMSKILAATDGQVTLTRLEGALAKFFGQLAHENGSGETRDKLQSMQELLNRGLDFSVESRQPEADQEIGLAARLNQFFNVKPNLSSDGDGLTVKGFDSSFRRVEIKVGDRQRENGFIDCSETPGDGDHSATIDMAASFLRNQVANEDAAAYIENNGAADFLSSVATAAAIVREENGEEALRGFERFLNDQVAPALGNSNITVKGWQVGIDYNKYTEAELKNLPLADLADIGNFFIVDGHSYEEIEGKRHQGLSINWEYANGVGAGISVDLNELYTQYKNTKTVAEDVGKANLSQAVGNLVNMTA